VMLTAALDFVAAGLAPDREGADVGLDEVASSRSDAGGPGLVAVTKVNLSAQTG
jgi:hypothetical protein